MKSKVYPLMHALTLGAAIAPFAAAEPIPVTVDNFVRAETHLYFNNSVSQGGFGKFHHNRELLPIDHQTVIRGNRDTLYSTGVFDLDAGAVTVTLPDSGKRFMSLQIITEDQYTTTKYGAGPAQAGQDESRDTLRARRHPHLGRSE
jgi:hypothetical protein